MNVLPEFEGIDFKTMWEAIGPFIITLMVIFIYGVITWALYSRMNRGLLKDITGIAAILGLVIVLLASLEVTANIWSL